MIVIDASVMVGVFYSKDEFHDVSKQWFERHLMTGSLLTTPALSSLKLLASFRVEQADPGSHVALFCVLKHSKN